MQRAIAVFLTWTVCTMVGLRMSARMRTRKDLLAELWKAVHRVLLGIEHSNQPVWQLLNTCGGKMTSTAFCAIAQRIQSGERTQQAWRTEMEQGEGVAWYAMLNEAERLRMDSFFATLGTSERKCQKQNTELILQELEKSCRDAEEIYLKKGRVYRTMGILLGTGLGILFL